MKKFNKKKRGNRRFKKSYKKKRINKVVKKAKLKVTKKIFKAKVLTALKDRVEVKYNENATSQFFENWMTSSGDEPTMDSSGYLTSVYGGALKLG